MLQEADRDASFWCIIAHNAYVLSTEHRKRPEGRKLRKSRLKVNSHEKAQIRTDIPTFQMSK